MRHPSFQIADEPKGLGIRSNLSIGLVVILISAVTWVTTYAVGQEYLKDRMAKMELKQDRYEETVMEIHGELTEIHNLIKQKKRKNDD